ncbi:MAG TPA: hypothetical protein VF763_00990 [Candidatus Limnocylindrales bacterium]
MDHPRRPNAAPISADQPDTGGDMAQQDQSGADPSPDAADRVVAGDEPGTDQATGSSGGYGVGSGLDSSGGSGDGRSGEPDVEDETDWLRSGGAQPSARPEA